MAERHSASRSHKSICQWRLLAATVWEIYSTTLSILLRLYSQSKWKKSKAHFPIGSQVPAPLPAPGDDPRTFYTPLKWPFEIRVVTLERGSGNDPICCKLTGADFTQPYEAISYEWGPRGDNETIFLNGVAFPVRRNLHDALRQFRRSENRVLWVDALCINQADDKEKNKQLPMLGTIYSQAMDTLVWLGPARDDSDLAISHLKIIGLSDYDASSKIIGNKAEPHELEMRAILALCSRTYWQRIWVVQEIRLSRQITLYCGDKTIAEETFSRAGKYIENGFNGKIPHLLKQIGDSLASKIMNCSRFDDLRLKDWLIITRESLSSDPKDRVRALANLATDCRGSSKLNIDCSKTVSVSQIYKDVMSACCVENLTQKPVHDVFDLSQELQRALSTPSESVQLQDTDTDPIWICGVFSAQITSFQNDRRATWSHALYPKNISEGDDTLWSTKLTECILNPTAGNDMAIIRKRRHSDFQAPVQIVSAITIAAAPQMLELDDALFELQAMCRRLKLKDSQYRGRPFRCGGGQDCTGFAPTDAEIGDRICRFPGSRIGLLFRRLVDHEDAWWLVGRVITDRRFQISNRDIKNFWRGNPRSPESVSFGCDDAWYLRLNMVTLQRLTAD